MITKLRDEPEAQNQMKHTYETKKFSNADIATSVIATEMKARRDGMAGYCVVFEDGPNESHKRDCRALRDAIWDLVAWSREHNGKVEIFTNANHEIALRLPKN